MKDYNTIMKDLKTVQNMPFRLELTRTGECYYTCTRTMLGSLKATAAEAEQAIRALLRDRDSLMEQLTEADDADI